MKTTAFSKAWGILILFLVVAESVFLGSDLQASNWHSAVVDGALLGFWIFGIVFFHAMSLKEQASDIEHKHLMKDLDKTLNEAKDKLLKEILGNDDDDDIHDPLTEKLMETIHDVAGHKKPTVAQLKTIKKKFEATTGHEVIFSPESDGLGVKIGKKPMKKATK